MLRHLSYMLGYLILIPVGAWAQYGDKGQDYSFKDEFTGMVEKTIYIVKGPCSFNSFYVSPTNFTEMILDANPIYGDDFTHTGTLKLGTKEFKFENAKQCNSLILENTTLLMKKNDESDAASELIQKGIDKNAAEFQKRKDLIQKAIDVQNGNISTSESNCETRQGILEDEMGKLLQALLEKYAPKQANLEGKKPLEQIQILQGVKNANDQAIAGELSASLSLYNEYLLKFNAADDTKTNALKIYIAQKAKLEKELLVIEAEEAKVQAPLYKALQIEQEKLEVFTKQLESSIVASVTYPQKDFAKIPAECGFEFKEAPIKNMTGAYFESTQDNDLCRCDNGNYDGKKQFMCYRTIGTTNVKATADKISTTGKDIKIEARKYTGKDVKGKGETY